MAVILSAATFPGAGQFYQKRFFVGALYCVPFLVCFCMVIIYFVKLLIAMFQSGGPSWPEFLQMGLWVLVSFAIYGLGLIDTILANKRMAKAEQQT